MPELKLVRYLVEMERVGRHRYVEPFEIVVNAGSVVAVAAQLADSIWHHIRRQKLLASKAFEVIVGLDDAAGATGEVSLGRAGSGKLTLRVER